MSAIVKSFSLVENAFKLNIFFKKNVVYKIFLTIRRTTNTQYCESIRNNSKNVFINIGLKKSGLY